MYVIVVGGGTVGYYMSRDLLERGHEVTLIERDARRADWLETQLGSIVMRGDGCEVKFLAQTGIERADAIIAVTAEDEDNLVALQMAKRHFKVKKTVARVNNPANVDIFKALGVDEAVSATEILLRALEPAQGELQTRRVENHGRGRGRAGPCRLSAQLDFPIL